MERLSHNTLRVLEYRAKHFKPGELNECELLPDEEPKGVDNSYIGYGLVPEYYQEQNPLSDEQIQEAIERYQAGASTYVLAREFGCHRSTVSRSLQKNGITVTHSASSKPTLCQKILQLYADHMKPADITQNLGIGVTTVRKILHENNVRIRHSSEYKKE